MTSGPPDTRQLHHPHIGNGESAMSPEHLIAWLAAELYAIRAAVIYWRLHTSSIPAESAELRWQMASTPALRLVAPALLRALPVIAELTCLINGLLWGPELLTRPWRT
jgi:hypothetical protein